MFPTTSTVGRELKDLCLRRAALVRLINSLEEYSLLTRREQKHLPISRLIQPDRRVLARPILSCKVAKPISIGKRALDTIGSQARSPTGHSG